MSAIYQYSHQMISKEKTERQKKERPKTERRKEREGGGAQLG